MKKIILPDITDKQELWAARCAAVVAICIAGYFGINPPGFVAQVVALAFGLAASSLFPALVMGIFFRRMNREGAVAGMITGLLFTIVYIWCFKFGYPELNSAEHWWWGISPEGIGAVGMVINFAVSALVAKFTAATPEAVRDMVEEIRIPARAGIAHQH